MIDLQFSILEARVEPYAAAPTLAFKLRVDEGSGERIHTMSLRCQVQIEPHRRNHDDGEKDRLLELFGEPERWGDTVRSLHWLQTSLMVPGFRDRIEIDLTLPCTYDFDVTSAKYFNALRSGDVPLVFLFSGTVFAKGDDGFVVHQVPWEKEAQFQMPVALWSEVMDRYFPRSAWIRLQRDSLDALQEFRARRALTSWEQTFDVLLEHASREESA